MPELPEVETIKLGLEKRIVGLTIQDIEVSSPKSAQFKPQEVIGQKVLKVWRRAKILGIDLDGHGQTHGSAPTLLIHLKMTGQLIWEKDSGQRQNDRATKGYDGEEKLIGGHPTEDMLEAMPNKSTRVIFTFSNGSHLYFNDQRRFGWIKLVQSEVLRHPERSEGSIPELQNLGPEPLEKGFTWEVVKKQLLKRKKTPIKVALMDQTIVAGIGNIYASESLFLAKINPKKLVGDLSDQEFQQLVKSIKEALEISLKHGGSTRAHFVDVEGKRGRFLDFANVYNLEGKPCNVCGTQIKRLTQAGRSTFYCPECQK